MDVFRVHSGSSSGCSFAEFLCLRDHLKNRVLFPKCVFIDKNSIFLPNALKCMNFLFNLQASANPNPMVKAELNLLAHLMGAVEKKSSGGTGKENDFRISMFSTDEEEE